MHCFCAYKHNKTRISISMLRRPGSGTRSSIAQPALLGKLNAYQVLRVLQPGQELSRAEIARSSGISAPTVSRAVESLLQAGLLEEMDAREAVPGRPARKLRLARISAQVVGVVIDAEECTVSVAVLDGRATSETVIRFATPPDYDELISDCVAAVGRCTSASNITTLGVGISVPGLIDARNNMSILSPNVPQTNGHSPAADIGALLPYPCVMIHETQGLCLAESRYGAARGRDDFALLDISTGIGLSVMDGGRILSGHSGLAGEIGHITVDLHGRQCGCGNKGCLETVASDTAMARQVGAKLNCHVTIEQVLAMARSGEYWPEEELSGLLDYLAIGVAAIVNLFNPGAIFIYGRLFELSDRVFQDLIERVRQRTLPPSFADCDIVRAQANKLQAAHAGIIEHLVDSVAPSFSAMSSSGTTKDRKPHH